MTEFGQPIETRAALAAKTAAALVALLITMVIGEQTAQAQRPPRVQWSQQRIDHTIGTGQGAANSVQMTLSADGDISGASLWVVPELQPFVRLTPETLPQIEAGQEYDVSIEFVVPPMAIQGRYDGTIHVRTGRRTVPRVLPVSVTVDYGDIQISPETLVIPSDVAEFLVVSADQTILQFSTLPNEIASGLQVGGIIVVGVTPVTPLGLLRRIDSLVFSQGGVTITTSPAPLPDAIRSASISVSSDLLPGDVVPAGTAVATGGVGNRSARAFRKSAATLGNTFAVVLNDIVFYDHDGDLNTTGDQITLGGGVEFTQSFDLDFTIDEPGILEEISFVSRTTEESELSLAGDVNLIDFHPVVEIARFNVRPIVVWVAWVPVVITPILHVDAGLDGNVSVGIRSSVSHTAELTAGLSFENGNWTPFSDFSQNFDFVPPTLSASADIKPYAGPQMDLLLYGAAGPYVAVRGYLELNADIAESPWWRLFGGVEASAGIKVQILSRVLVDFDFPRLIDFRIPLAVAQDPPPGPAGFFDDFDDGDSSSWQAFAGGWTESGGIYRSTNTSANTPVESVYGGGYSWSDYDASVEVVPLSKHSPVETGLLFRFNQRTLTPNISLGQCTLYHGGFSNGDFGSFLRLSVDANGQHEELARAPFGWQAGTEYTIRVIAVGNQITCSVDGGPTLTATSNIIEPTGTVGMRSTHIQSSYDNLRVILR